MASVSSVGIGSGVLTSDLIDKLVEAERAPTEKRLDFKEEEITTELSIFGQIQSAVTDLRLPSRSLADPTLFQTLSASSGNDAFSASASSDAQPGSYSLEVSALAKAHSLSSAEFADADTTTIGTGTLSITINGATENITIDGTNNTLNGIAAAINENADLKANASVLYTGTGYSLVITSQETGVVNAMDIAVTDTGDGNNIDNLGLSQLSYTSGATNLTQNQGATDAAFSLNGISLTRSSNTITDVLEGVTLTLSGTNAGSPASLTISRDNDLIVEKVEEFVEKFNALQALISENTVFNPDNPAASGILLGDSSTRTIINQIQSIFGQSILGLETASVRSMADVGLTTNKDTGQLEFDSSKFISKLNADATAVAGVFADQGAASDSQIEFVRAGAATKVGTYAVNISQLATRGAFTGNVALGGSTTIDANNDTFSLSVDGTSSGTITLDAGSYTPAQLATEIQTKINADSALSAAGKSVTVSVDGSNQLVITSNIFGSSSTVNIDAVDTNTAATLGLSVANGTDGLDVAGTINGQTATGSGQFLTA
ncbi:MAG: flagellar filament capping protein FliD, partial [Reinekea sp.]|nr:flagellar filament capping protein FliD [Reinekea sp.]